MWGAWFEQTMDQGVCRLRSQVREIKMRSVRIIHHRETLYLPYSFSLPLLLPQVFAWMTILVRAHRGELHP